MRRSEGRVDLRGRGRGFEASGNVSWEMGHGLKSGRSFLAWISLRTVVCLAMKSVHYLAMDVARQTTEVLVVGAGMAGLIAAGELQRAGRRVLVLDKGRGVGGRLASRRLDGATFDHGAQFITTRDARFAAVLERGREAGAVDVWCHGFAGRADGHERWRGKPAMSSVAKYLAGGLELRLETQVTALRVEGGRWCAETAKGPAFIADSVVLTPPVPQSLAMLDAGGFVLEPVLRAHLAAIEYERCLAVMAVLEGPSRLPFPGGVALEDGPIAWIADNWQKGVSAEPAVTVHGSPAFSLEFWDRDRQESGQRLLDAAAVWIGSGVRTFQVHGWRYSKPVRVDELPCRRGNESPPLVFAGDAFAGPRVEGAALSGWAAAESLLSH